MKKILNHLSDQGFSLIEVIAGGAVLVGLTMASMTFLKNQGVVTQRLENKAEFSQFMFTFQKKLARTKDVGLATEAQACKVALEGAGSFSAANLATITDENTSSSNPMQLDVPTVMDLMGGAKERDGKYYYSSYEIDKIMLYGTDSGLEEVGAQGNKITYEGKIVIQFKKLNEIVRAGSFEILLSVDDGNLESCAPVLFSASEQGYSTDICKRMLGEDFQIDPATGDCLVPVYTNCTTDACKDSLISTARSKYLANQPAEVAPVGSMKLQDVMCDLVLRGSVPGKNYCTN